MRIGLREAIDIYSREESPSRNNLEKLKRIAKTIIVSDVSLSYACWKLSIDEALQHSQHKSFDVFRDRITIHFTHLSYTDALDGLLADTNDTKIINDRLSFLARHGNHSMREAIRNITSEKQLIGLAWIHVYRMILNSLEDLNALRGCMGIGFSYFTLTGKHIDTINGFKKYNALVYGRVIEADRLISLIGSANTLSSIKARDLLKKFRKPPNDYPLGNYHMWSTYNTDTPDEPFSKLPLSAQRLTCRLGLPHNPASRYALLTYTIPVSVKVRIPTIADAYAGSYWSPLFRVFDEMQLFPRTCPRDGGCLPSIACDKECENIKGGLYECVHETIMSGNLSNPIPVFVT